MSSGMQFPKVEQEFIIVRTILDLLACPPVFGSPYVSLSSLNSIDVLSLPRLFFSSEEDSHGFEIRINILQSNTLLST